MMLGELKEATDELLEVADAGGRARSHATSNAEALLLLGDIDQRQGRPPTRIDRLLEARETRGLDRRRSPSDESGIRARHVRRLTT